MNYQFDATQYQPNQGAPKHPDGKFPAIISGAAVNPNKDQQGGHLAVTFKTQHGEITRRYNLWHASQDTVRIAHEQLSALCHAVGRMQIDMSNPNAALMNSQCVIEVGPQAKNPAYNEVLRVLDMNGNEPGKGAPTGGGFPGGGQAPGGFPGGQQPPQQPNPGWGAPQPQQQPNPAPQGQQAPWGAPQGGGQPQPQPQGQPWPGPGGNQQPAPQAQPQQQPPAGGGWQPGGQQQGGANPPWQR